jgi:hypothetical protein
MSSSKDQTALVTQVRHVIALKNASSLRLLAGHAYGVHGYKVRTKDDEGEVVVHEPGTIRTVNEEGDVVLLSGDAAKQHVAAVRKAVRSDPVTALAVVSKVEGSPALRAFVVDQVIGDIGDDVAAAKHITSVFDEGSGAALRELLVARGGVPSALPLVVERGLLMSAIYEDAEIQEGFGFHQSFQLLGWMQIIKDRADYEEILSMQVDDEGRQLADYVICSIRIVHGDQGGSIDELKGEYGVEMLDFHSSVGWTSESTEDEEEEDWEERLASDREEDDLEKDDGNMPSPEEVEQQRIAFAAARAMREAEATKAQQALLAAAGELEGEL